MLTSQKNCKFQSVALRLTLLACVTITACTAKPPTSSASVSPSPSMQQATVPATSAASPDVTPSVNVHAVRAVRVAKAAPLVETSAVSHVEPPCPLRVTMEQMYQPPYRGNWDVVTKQTVNGKPCAWGIPHQVDEVKK